MPPVAAVLEAKLTSAIELGVHHVELPDIPELTTRPLHNPFHAAHVVGKGSGEQRERFSQFSRDHPGAVHPFDIAITDQGKVAEQRVNFGLEDGSGKDRRLAPHTDSYSNGANDDPATSSRVTHCRLARWHVLSDALHARPIRLTA